MYLRVSNFSVSKVCILVPLKLAFCSFTKGNNDSTVTVSGVDCVRFSCCFVLELEPRRRRETTKNGWDTSTMRLLNSKNLIFLWKYCYHRWVYLHKPFCGSKYDQCTPFQNIIYCKAPKKKNNIPLEILQKNTWLRINKQAVALETRQINRSTSKGPRLHNTPFILRYSQQTCR